MELINFGELVVPLPTNWVLQTVIAISPKQEDTHFRPNFVISYQEIEDDETLETFVPKQIEQLQRALDSYRVLNRQIVNVAGTDIYKLESSFVVNAGELSQKLWQLQAFVISFDRVYIITSTDNANNYLETKNLTDTVLASLRLSDSEGP